MKYVVPLLYLFSLPVQASPFMTVKDRLRVHMWVYGLEQDRPSKAIKQKLRALPEELERALKKI
jgi:hypothetical protein